MTKTKYQRGLCVFHGCKNVGTVTPNATQRFCQSHWDMLKRDADEHEEKMRQIHEWGEQRRAKLLQP